MPSINPTAKPTSSPSKVPTSTPTATPSLVPTGSPTEEAFKTKAGNTAIILRDIDKEMSDSHLTHFEVTTLEFIQDTMPHTDGYELEILAVTLLSQTPIYPDSTENQEEIPTDHKNATHNVVVDKNHTNLNLNTPAVAPAGGNSRRLTSSYLKVTFKVVGVVTSGVAPRDFNFTKDIINVGFANHMDEYLYRLSKVDVYFAPLKAHTSITDPDDIAKKGQFVAAVVFSILAFFVAVFASVYAIRRHLEAKRRRRNRRMRLSNKFQPSETYSEEGSTDKDQSDEEDPAHLNTPLQVTISRDTVGLENVPITPRSIASPFKEDYRPEETSPLSPGTAKLSSWVPPATLTSTRDQRPTSIFAETGETFRKWLTPTFASPVENPFRPPRPSSSPDPIALKASTTTGKVRNMRN
jgi:heme exporter protein D